MEIIKIIKTSWRDTPDRLHLPTFFIFAGIAPKDKTSESKTLARRMFFGQCHPLIPLIYPWFSIDSQYLHLLKDEIAK